MPRPRLFQRRSRKQALKEQTSDYVSKHRKTLTASIPVRGDITKRRTLYKVNVTMTKPRPWTKKRKNRAANKVARASRRMNQQRRRA